MNPLRVLLVGDWRWDHYEAALEQGFRALGCETLGYSEFPGAVNLPTAALTRLRTGPQIRRIQCRLVKCASQFRPELVFFYACDTVDRRTIKRIRQAVPAVVLMAFHNDNPYHGLKCRVKWRHFLQTIPEMDCVFVYRPSNLDDVRAYRSRRADLLLPHYMSSRHRPYARPSIGPDVVYVGHYEGDGRAEIIESMAAAGLHVELYGAGWDAAPKHCAWIRSAPRRTLFGDEYARKLSEARIGLVFLSTHNLDVWTRRCFEIPACGTMMLAPRTAELEAIFRDGLEAAYYDDADSAVALAQRFVHDHEARESIAAAGLRVCQAGHSEIHRARQLVNAYQRVIAERHNPRVAGEVGIREQVKGCRGGSTCAK